MFKVFLVDESNGNYYNRYESYDRFDCEVYVYRHKYDAPIDCHYEIEDVTNALDALK